MITIKFQKECGFNGQVYKKDTVLENITVDMLPAIWKLNEKGFIYPLTLKEFTQFQKEIEKPKKSKKEEE